MPSPAARRRVAGGRRSADARRCTRRPGHSQPHRVGVRTTPTSRDGSARATPDRVARPRRCRPASGWRASCRCEIVQRRSDARSPAWPRPAASRCSPSCVPNASAKTWSPIRCSLVSDPASISSGRSGPDMGNPHRFTTQLLDAAVTARSIAPCGSGFGHRRGHNLRQL